MALDLSAKASYPVDMMRQTTGMRRISKKKSSKQRKHLTWSLAKTFLEYQKHSALHDHDAEAPERHGCIARCNAADDTSCVEEATPEAMQRCSAQHQMAPAFDSSPLPEDPRHWSRPNVRTWIMHMKSSFELLDVSADRFPMNGKALCLMSPDMFSFRVPSAGRLLYRDFRLRLAKAMHSSQSS